MTGSIIPNKNNVVVVSYESMMLLKEAYIDIMFDALGLDSPDEIPFIIDGNRKYTEPPPKEEYNGWRKIYKFLPFGGK